MDKRQRQAQMLEILRDSGAESVRLLADRLGVTEMTVRRDIRPLREDGLLKVVSGAVLFQNFDGAGTSEDYFLSDHSTLRSREKDEIGQLAASLVEPHDVVYIDIGTTTSALIRHLPAGIPIVAVCCTVNALTELQKKGIEDIIFLGGHYVPSLQMFESREGVELLHRTRVTKAFLSAAGVAERLGVTCVNGCEVETKTAALRSALIKILMVDSQKFGVVKPAFFARIEEFDAVVTDGTLSAPWREALRADGVTVHLSSECSL